MLQIIRYRLRTKDLSPTFEWGSGLEISVFADANYAEKADYRRSVSGVAATVGKSSVNWFSSTQKTVTLSTTEAEYIALGDGVKEALFVKGVISFIIPSISENCIKVFVDSDGAISLRIIPRVLQGPSTSTRVFTLFGNQLDRRRFWLSTFQPRNNVQTFLRRHSRVLSSRNTETS